MPLNAAAYPVYPQASTTYRLTAYFNPQQALDMRPQGLRALSPPMAFKTAPDRHEAITSTEATATVKMKACPLRIIETTLHPGETSQTVLPAKATHAAPFIAGFHYTHDKQKNRKVSMWRVEGTATLNKDGTRLTVGSEMVLKDNSGHGLSPEATLSLVTICYDDDAADLLMTSHHPRYDIKDFTYDGADYHAIHPALTKFAVWPKGNHETKLKRAGVYVSQPGPQDITVDPQAGQTDVHIDFYDTCPQRRLQDRLRHDLYLPRHARPGGQRVWAGRRDGCGSQCGVPADGSGRLCAAQHVAQRRRGHG